jgi:peptidoglycan L-alanyl-D-glutamate endopeptidase CwlK
MAFKLGKRSNERLESLHPSLVRVVRHAITVTPIDFSVGETLRSLERQKQLVAAKSSQTLNSKHRMQPDGFSHAVDLVALIGGKADWSMDSYYQIADAMKLAAIKCGVRVRWGGAWNVQNLAEFEGTAREAQMFYIQTRIQQKQKYFLDGPHFELS